MENICILRLLICADYMALRSMAIHEVCNLMKLAKALGQRKSPPMQLIHQAF